MRVVSTCLRLLMPRGRPWALAGDGEKLFDGLGVTLERPRTAARSLLAEARPGTAVLMLPEWCLALGVKYDPTMSIADLQARLDAIDTALADMTLNELNGQMHKERPSVNIMEMMTGNTSECGVAECGADECNSTDSGSDIDPYQYLVYGTVQNDTEYARVLSVVQHYAPLHLIMQTSIVNLSASGTSECGVEICGIAECGYAP
jgi:hypothetical protein